MASDPEVARRRRIVLGRWCITFRHYRPTRYSPRFARYTRGGQRTPGPWWSLEIRHMGEFVVTRDRTLFEWGNADGQ